MVEKKYKKYKNNMKHIKVYEAFFKDDNKIIDDNYSGVMSSHFARSRNEEGEETIEQPNTIPFDDDIIKKLKVLYRGSEFEKSNMVDDRIEQLFKIHSEWLKNAKRYYNAETIAKNLFRYEKI
jgi:hypothetical protein